MDNYENPKPGKTYISPSLPSFGGGDRRVRIASKVIESIDSYAFAKVRDEIVLRHREGAQTHIKAKFIEDDRGIFVLSIQGYTVAADKPHNASFSFVGEEIAKLAEFIENIQAVPLPGGRAVNITDEELRRLIISAAQARHLVEENEELFSEVIRSAVTKQDVVAVGYRKRQLEVFEKLLRDQEYFEELTARKGCSEEALWQQYFEKNPWIFGYGLDYIYLSSFDNRKLEQTVSGHTVGSRGKRVDALMKSRGVLSSLCFIEIKTHRTPLTATAPYRAGCWAVSQIISQAVAQVQGTVAAATENIRRRLEITDSEGNPTGERAYSFTPKAYLVIGDLSEFVSESGANEERYRSFELFRGNLFTPEIITFDELYERARFIVRESES